MTVLVSRKPPEDDKPARSGMTDHFIRAFPVARAVCEAEHGPGSTLAERPATERVGYQHDAIAALRRRNTVARNIAVYKAAEVLFHAEMDRRNLSHLADWRNMEPKQRQRFIDDAAAVDATVHQMLSGELDGGL